MYAHAAPRAPSHTYGRVQHTTHVVHTHRQPTSCTHKGTQHLLTHSFFSFFPAMVLTAHRHGGGGLRRAASPTASVADAASPGRATMAALDAFARASCSPSRMHACMPRWGFRSRSARGSSGQSASMRSSSGVGHGRRASPITKGADSAPGGIPRAPSKGHLIADAPSGPHGRRCAMA
jgi:hypothetical protein